MNGLYGAFEIISKAIILSLWTTEKERSSLWKDYRSRSVLPFTESSIKLIISVQYEKPKAPSVRQKWNDLLLLMLMDKI